MTPNAQPARLPSVDRLVRKIAADDLPRQLVVAVVRRELAALRKEQKFYKGDIEQAAITNVHKALETLRRSRLQSVINATGIIIHTNLGRSPMGAAVVSAISQAAMDFTNLEYDLTAGQRGSRGAYAEQALAALCNAAAATVVNNCAAALVLILHHFAARDRKEVIISRGELIQIGGGFRIPEILEASGATLREVGTTNKTTAADYRRAIGPGTALILKVHHSNFYMEGFVESPGIEDLASIAREHGLPLVEDLGSGAMFDTAKLEGGEREPKPQQSLAAGADLVCFSGDKLLGGPQAGIIVGSHAHVQALKKDPFFRALRCDKLILASLEATSDLLLTEKLDAVPIRAMMHMPVEEIETRAQDIAAKLAGLPATVTVGPCQSQVGGGSLPKTKLPSFAIRLRPRDPALSIEQFAERLRLTRPPVIGHIERDELVLDLRTVFPRQDTALTSAIAAALGPIST